MKTRKAIASILIAAGFIIAFAAMAKLEQGAALGQAYALEFFGLSVSILGMLWVDGLERRSK